MENFDMKKLVKVTNRCGGMAIYKIPEHGIRREFIAGESKMIPYEELVWLSYQPGGRNMMSNTFLIEEVKATKELNIHTEPEYFMTEADVINMLQNGSVDELKDALDFAPTGVVQIIKDQAVALPIYDMRKRQAILEMTGFDVTSAITNSEPDPDEVVEAPAATRRVQREETPETPVAPARRTAPKYKVIEE
jgi:hypothetical protein